MSAEFLAQFGAGDKLDRVEFVGDGAYPSPYSVTDFASAAVACAGMAAQSVVELLGGSTGATIVVDRRLASLWFGMTIAPDGWSLPAVWDDLAGDYRATDSWLKLHTNAPRHRAAVLEVLGCEPTRSAVEVAVHEWRADELEYEVVTAGGCAAVMRSSDAWKNHPQGAAVGQEPLVHRSTGTSSDRRPPDATPSRPLDGVRVLDLTRILAGPVATRFLAGLGADVLRIDPLDWDEPALAPEVTLGKRCAKLDLRNDEGRRIFERLLGEADIFVHGYRPGALEGLGLGEGERMDLAPGLVEVSLDAYGWTGPWAGRRGFDSLVQMSCGIASAGQVATGADRPVPLPVQALDHATGYLLAAEALRGWRARLTSAVGSVARVSLARTAHLLTAATPGSLEATLQPATPDDYSPNVEPTPWGPARRLKAPLTLPGTTLEWNRPSSMLGSEPSPPSWAPTSSGDQRGATGAGTD